jgi:hypothetical protein
MRRSERILPIGLCGIAIVPVALGALFFWLLPFSVAGLDLETVGAILMLVGGLASVVAFPFWIRLAGIRPRSRR